MCPVPKDQSVLPNEITDLFSKLSFPSEITDEINDFLAPRCSALYKQCDNSKVVCGKKIQHTDPSKEGYCSDECQAVDRRSMMMDFLKAHLHLDSNDEFYKLHGSGFLCPHCNVYVPLHTIPLWKTPESYKVLYQHFNQLCSRSVTMSLMMFPGAILARGLEISCDSSHFNICTRLFEITSDPKKHCTHCQMAES